MENKLNIPPNPPEIKRFKTLTFEQIDTIQDSLFQKFKNADINHKNELNLIEFKKLFKDLMPWISDDNINELFDILDKNGDGGVSYSEFLDSDQFRKFLQHLGMKTPQPPMPKLMDGDSNESESKLSDMFDEINVGYNISTNLDDELITDENEIETQFEHLKAQKIFDIKDKHLIEDYVSLYKSVMHLWKTKGKPLFNRVNDIETELHDTKSELHTYKYQFNELLNHNIELKSEINTLKDDLNSYQNENNELALQNRISNMQIKKLTNVSENTSIDELRITIPGNNNNNNNDNENFRDKYNQLKPKYKLLETQYSTNTTKLLAEIETLKSENNRYEKRVKEYEQELKIRIKEIQDRDQIIRKLDINAQEFQNQLNNLDNLTIQIQRNQESNLSESMRIAQQRSMSQHLRALSLHYNEPLSFKSNPDTIVSPHIRQRTEPYVDVTNLDVTIDDEYKIDDDNTNDNQETELQPNIVINKATDESVQYYVDQINELKQLLDDERNKHQNVLQALNAELSMKSHYSRKSQKYVNIQAELSEQSCDESSPFIKEHKKVGSDSGSMEGFSVVSDNASIIDIANCVCCGLVIW